MPSVPNKQLEFGTIVAQIVEHQVRYRRPRSQVYRMRKSIDRRRRTSSKVFFSFFFCFTTLIENLDNDTADGTVVLDSPVEVAQDAPVAPPRSIRRDGFRRTAVRHVDGNSLLDELSRQINQELIEIKVVTI